MEKRDIFKNIANQAGLADLEAEVVQDLDQVLILEEEDIITATEDIEEDVLAHLLIEKTEEEIHLLEVEVRAETEAEVAAAQNQEVQEEMRNKSFK